MKHRIGLALLALAIGCSKPDQSSSQSAERTSSQTVLAYYDALNQADSVQFLSLISTQRREWFRDNPARMKVMMSWWKNRRHEVRILSDSEEPNLARATYHLHVLGYRPDDSNYAVQLYKEDGKWKMGI